MNPSQSTGSGKATYEHREASREAIPAMDHEDTGWRVVCSCGRAIRSTMPWLIDKWMADHDYRP